MAIHTQLTTLLDIDAPIILAPMAGVAGGALAAAVTRAGGLGLIGGGYGDPAWVERQWELADGADVGIGFINWKLSEDDRALRSCLERGVKAVLLSFGDITPFASAVKSSGAKLIAQVQTLEDAKRAADAGADVIVAQGTEAGGHSGQRATLPLVPAVVDAVGNIPVVAAGGIADGRGLAAALMLGAAGVMCGSAFYPCDEALSHDHAKDSAISGKGDDTIYSGLFDMVRGLNWPSEWKIRTLSNNFSRRWADQDRALAEHLSSIAAEYRAAAPGDMQTVPTIVGEAADLLTQRRSAADTMADILLTAQALLGHPPAALT
ncbi:NAD(P)H-dependent flavin oxidoreductase [Sphingopyxis yananensis]|uniref:NAD(P)H-dependent flavin oxidoreductase n=1 Tax=Sphingopyxis yananensis TaxID=2886687 RepID=UPI001D1220A7|nr:nitronate monooxygenase [Sphingopyxis yananensis]MCC2602629.1 nitronate monooxygenase [Sphingopyxis yananensis]